MENQQVKKCSYCRNEKSINEYMSDAGRELKMCKRCRSKKRPICIHNKRIDICRECGIGFCIHSRRKYNCKDCGTGEYKNKAPKEKYHINETEGVIHLTWTENNKQKRIRKWTTKRGYDIVMNEILELKNKMIEEDKLK